MLQDAASRRPEPPRITGWYILLPLLAAAACPICFFLFDQPIARFFRSIDHSILVRMAGYLTDLGQAGWYIGGAGLLYLVWRYWRPS
ncbi:hypothetical protein, partial [Ferrovibrio sp.]|uniref:hypothetical protein n=1 Tax=Ferrovibrio sp. TaxID=1917215 RepID=UPI002611DBEC